MHYFFGTNIAASDIFVRIRQEKNKFKHIKRFLKGDPIPVNVLERFSKYGAQNLYIPTSERHDVAKVITKDIISKLSDKNSTVEEKALALDSSINVVSDSVKSYGLTKESVTLAKTAMHSIKELSKEVPSIRQLLKTLLDNKASYLYLHCQIATFVSFHIVDNSEWGTDEHKMKLSFVAFFHDIFLDSEHYARIRTNDELEKSNFSKEIKDKIKNHARFAADAINDYPKAPIGVDTIIRQHHGIVNGIGFPKKYSNEISPLAIVFIVAEEFTDLFLSGKDFPDVSEIVSQLESKLTGFKYRKALKCLRDLPNAI